MMRYLLVVCAVLVTCLFSFSIQFNGAGASDQNSKGSFAVVELFTSEGCSSCPPADKLLGEIAATAREKRQAIFALAFHVDYWDYIGWKDPYARRQYSDRQRRYAQAFNSNRIYTPQMIVNGREEFVGSNRSRAKSSIQRALSKAAALELKLERKEAQAGELKVAYSVSDLPEDTVLNLALAERGLVQKVGRGENSGRTLNHDNVVRSFKSIKLEKRSGVTGLGFSAAVDLSNCSIIGYLQDESSMEILAARAIEP